jgi:PIN domain nuclease of toxin-antitoxin system
MAGSSRLSAVALQAIASPDNDPIVSTATAWEIAIKRAIGKLQFPGRLAEAIQDEGFGLLAITLSHIEAIESLPHHHRDPFDRMLIAQATVEGLRLVSCDNEIAQYGVPLLW